MVDDRGPWSGPQVDAVLAAAVDHVRLSYHYLDIGDSDGYSSLFEEEAVLTVPGWPPVRGRAALERYSCRLKHRHAVHHVFGSDRRVAAVGRLMGPAGFDDRDFVDLFAVSDRALLTERRCFFAVALPSMRPFDEH